MRRLIDRRNTTQRLHSWDDDVDIFMPRPEYEKFCKLYVDSCEYKLFCIERNNSYLNFARVCDMKKTIAEPYLKWATEETSIGIDILPLDGISCSKEEFVAEIAPDLLKRDELLYQLRSFKTKLREAGSIYRFCQLIGKRLKYFNYDFDKEINAYQQFIKQDYEQCDNCGQLSCTVTIKKEFQPKWWFEEYILTEFEGTEAMIIKEYDKQLRNIFGDYMQLPPEEKRTPKHSEHMICWK